MSIIRDEHRFSFDFKLLSFFVFLKSSIMFQDICKTNLKTENKGIESLPQNDIF